MAHINEQREEAQHKADDAALSLSEAVAAVKAKDEEIESAVVCLPHMRFTLAEHRNVSLRHPHTSLPLSMNPS